MTTVEAPGASGASACGVTNSAKGDAEMSTTSEPLVTGPVLVTVTFTKSTSPTSMSRLIDAGFATRTGSASIARTLISKTCGVVLGVVSVKRTVPPSDISDTLTE